MAQVGTKALSQKERKKRKTGEAIIVVSTLEFISARTQQVARARNKRHQHIVLVGRLIKFVMPSCTLVYLSSFPKTDLFGGFLVAIY